MKAHLLSTLIALAATLGVTAAQGVTVVGRATAETPLPDDVAVCAFAVRMHVRSDGRAVPPTKDEIYTAATCGRVAQTGADGRFELHLEPGAYAVFAFADVDADRRWDPAIPEPFGWETDEPAGTWTAVGVGAAGSGSELAITLRAPMPFSGEAKESQHGSLRRIDGYPVLQLRGDAHERGFAHGELVARQIVDFFRCYVLEDKLRSAQNYRTGFERFLESHFALPAEFVAECEAVIEGMRASGVDLSVPELGRDFSLTDLLAINAYIETRAMRSSCTQFAAWGDRTAGTDVDAGMITGRNMDGECDLRKVTVSHFLIFAVTPTEPGRKRYVSMMWPGFVGTISGINEDGFYTMENAGGTGPGPVVDRLVPISWTMREALARLDGSATPARVKSLCDGFANAAGGSCGPGCIMLFAVPFTGQPNPAFVFEGDRFGDAIRLPGAVRPLLADAILCSNHFLAYGADPDRPGTYFGREPGFSSAWRYEAGMNKLEGWDRVNRKIGTVEMRELLQTVAHGSTEYAVITRPNAREFDIAVASLAAEPWDAPYRQWTRFHFDDVFAVSRDERR